MGKRVTIENFARAETDRYFGGMATLGLGRLGHSRGLPRPGRRGVVRTNFDTTYSGGVFDLSSPVTVSLPDTGSRYCSLLVINQDQYNKLVATEPGDYTLTQEAMGTRYVMVMIRILGDLTDPADLAEVRALQDQISIEQADPGSFEVPDWDEGSRAEIREALAALHPHMGSEFGKHGDVDEVDPVKFLIAASTGWGGMTDGHVANRFVYPDANDGTVPHVIEVGPVPCDGFWSITVYDQAGFAVKNEWDRYSRNSLNTVADADGVVRVHLGGDPEASNHLPIFDGWMYTFRIYLPHAEVLEGRWDYPTCVPIR